MKIHMLAIAAGAVLMGATAFAQADPTVISPTTGSGKDAFAKNTTDNSASVQQTITLKLPKATALHLDVTSLIFDLTDLDGAQWAARAASASPVDFGGKMVCVYGFSDTDGITPLDDNFYNQKQYLPLGTSYSAAGWPNVKVNGNGVVNTYPPIRIGANGELVEGSKNYFVCYRTFKLQKFSNGTSWDLTVSRVDNPATNPRSIKNIYMQDNPCDTFGAPTGLYKLGASEAQGQPLHLVPRNLNFGPTGSRTPTNRANCGYKSWLDDLIIVALPVDGELNGENTAQLQYTLTTTAWEPVAK